MLLQSNDLLCFRKMVGVKHGIKGLRKLVVREKGFWHVELLQWQISGQQCKLSWASLVQLVSRDVQLFAFEASPSCIDFYRPLQE